MLSKRKQNLKKNIIRSYWFDQKSFHANAMGIHSSYYKRIGTIAKQKIPCIKLNETHKGGKSKNLTKK